MYKTQTIVKFTAAAVILCCCILPLCIAQTQKAELPARNNGDQWNFIVDYKGQTGIKFDLTTTVTSTGIQSPREGFDCFQLTSTGSGSVYGSGVSGTAEFTFIEYYRQSDYGLAEFTQNITTKTPTRSSMLTSTVYNPPLGINSGFPLEEGKQWVSNSTVSINTVTDAAGQVNQDHSSFDASVVYKVESTQSTTTEAGTFETFLIKATATDGSHQDIYYAPTVGMQVKEVDYNNAGEVVATMDLTSYALAQPSNSSSLQIEVVAVIVVVALVAVFLVFWFKHKKTKSETKTV